jgi:WD40 repeat protein
VAFSPVAGDYRALTGGGPVDGQLHLWDAVAGTETTVDFRENKLDTTAAVGDVEFSPDGKFALSCHSDQGVRVWDLARFELGKEVHVLKNVGASVRAAFSPDGKELATVTNGSGGLWLWDVQTGKKLRQLIASRRIATLMFLAGPGGGLSKDEPASAKDHRIVLTEGRAQVSNVHVYEAATGKEINPPVGHLGDVTCVELSPSGAVVASGSVDHTLLLWDMKKVEERHQVNAGQVTKVGFHPDGGRVFLHGPSHARLPLIDVATGQNSTPQYNGSHSGAILSAGITRDGRYAVTGGHDGMVYMWQLSDGKLVRDFDLGPGQGPAVVTVCPDMRRVIRVGGGKTRLLHLRCRQVIHEWNQTAWAPFLPDARAIFFNKPEAEVWKVTGDKPEKTGSIPIDLSGLSRGCLSADGKRAAGLIGLGVSVFDLDARAQVWQWIPPAHFGGVRDVALSPDGEHLLTANGDGTVYVIRINP